MNEPKQKYNILTIRRQLTTPVSHHVHSRISGSAFCVCLLAMFSLSSCDHEDTPVEERPDVLKVDTTWSGINDFDYDGNPIDKGGEVTIPLPDGIPEEGDAGEAV